MSHSAHEMHAEGGGLWLPLTEYAVKSGVSLSTIRRKIKSNTIPFKLEKGRYLILFQESEVSTRELTPVATIPTAAIAKLMEEPSRPLTRPIPQTQLSADRWDFPLFDRAVKMISEAFEHTLKEKDERIRLLEKSNQEQDERLSELKTLVTVLEDKYRVRY